MQLTIQFEYYQFIWNNFYNVLNLNVTENWVFAIIGCKYGNVDFVKKN